MLECPRIPMQHIPSCPNTISNIAVTENSLMPHGIISNVCETLSIPVLVQKTLAIKTESAWSRYIWKS